MATMRDKVYEELYPILERLVDITCEQIESIEKDDSDEFDIDMVLDQFEDYGKYKGVMMCNGDKNENYIPVSVAIQIVKAGGHGGILGYLNDNNDTVKDCSTCNNNVEYPPPHTCDICQGLDQEEDYEMWEGKDE